ncbi:MAG: hypothetical protein IPN83_16055 [Holophagales bacterium]|nr:hypothetical protein [Holophagales bacterium]
MPRRASALVAHLRCRGLALAVASAMVALAPRPALAQAPAGPPSEETPAKPAEPAEKPGSTSAPSELESLKSALDGIREGLGLSGFFDVRAADSRTDPNVFSMGDFELDLARAFGRHVQVGAAIVVNDEGAALAVGFVDIHMFGGLVAPRGRLPVEKGFHVQLGRFDVPFGNDWRYFAAKDRTELAAPLTTEAVMDGGYNDVGLRVLGNTGSLDYSAYWLRGEGKGTLVGGRLAFSPFDNPYRLHGRVRALELGVSALHDFDGDGGTGATAFAVDSELRGKLGHLRAEFLRRDQRPVEGRDDGLIRSGWHVTATLDAGAPAGIPMTPYARYDTVKEEPSSTPEPSVEGTGDRTERLSAGVNASLFEVLSVKLEYQRTLSAPPSVEAEEDFHWDSWLAQVVVSF